MDAQRGFLEAVRESPEDDLHRLAWADWLDDNGQPDRATFLRASVQASHQEITAPRRAELEEEAETLLDRHERQWLGPVRQFALDWRWRRGCVERVTVRASALLEAGDDLLATAPVHDARLLGTDHEFASLASWPGLAKLTALDLGVIPPDGEAPLTGFFLRGAALQEFLESPYLGQINSLRLTRHDCWAGAVLALVGRGFLDRLRALDLSECRAFGNQAASVLASSPAPCLEELNLLGTNLYPEGIRTILAAKGWPRLRSLGLGIEAPLMYSRSSMDRFEFINAPLFLRSRWLRVVGAVAHWWRSDLMPNSLLGPVEHLRVEGANPQALHLGDWPGLASVRRLGVVNIQTNESSLRPLVESSHLKAVEWLDLSNNRLGGPLLKALLSAPWLVGVQTLSLDGNHIGTHGMGLLAGSPWRRLRSLSLESSNIGPDALAALAGSPLALRLRSLRLSKNPIEDEGLSRLLEAGPLRLRELYLNECHLDSRACDVLCDGALLPHLRIVSARNNHFSAREKDRLRARFGVGWLG
jgi:uncharacterized protein (TIGR02996 family)